MAFFKIKIHFLFLFFVIGILMPLRGQDTVHGIINYRIGNYETFYSNILNEERTLLIHLPEDYETSIKKYPILYILDGEDTHRFIQGIKAIMFYSGVRRFPEMIVVGILNTERRRDITPNKVLQHKNSGMGDVFLKFVDSELIPYINKKYRSARYRILFGGSSAGMFTIYTMFSRSELFDAYIASRPALNSTDDYTWDSEIIFKKARDFFADRILLNKTIYIDHGGNEDLLHDPEPIYRLIALFKSKVSREFKWEVKKISESRYRSAESLKDGLLSIFETWYYPADSIYTQGFAGIKNYAMLLTEQFGYSITVADLLPERDILMFGYRFLENNNFAEALAFFKYAVTVYANSWNTFNSLADTYIKKGQVDLAIKNYEKSLKLNPDNKNAKEKLDELKNNEDL